MVDNNVYICYIDESEILGPVPLLRNLKVSSPSNFLLGCIAFATSVLTVTTTVGLNLIKQQLERQAVAAEQQTKLLQEPAAMSKELGELVKVLKEFRAMAAAEAASSPKK